MANELRHKQTGDDGLNLQDSEWIGVDTHIANGQTLGDTLYFNGAYWIRRPANIQNITLKTDSYLISASDYFVICDKTTAMTITLPAATGIGVSYMIKTINIGVVTIDANSSETIDGELTQTLNQWDCINIVDYASGKWLVI